MAELANRMELEADFARRLSRLSSRHRKELIALLGNPPDISRVPQDFWIKVENEHKTEVGTILALLFLASTEQHIDLLLPGDLRSVAIEDAADVADTWASERASTLSRQYAQNSRKKLSLADRRWYGTGPRVLGPTAEEFTGSEIYEPIADIFGPARDAGIAATETTRANTAGAKSGIDKATEFGVTTTVTWYTEADGRVCPVCAPLHGAAMDEWESIGINAEISANGGPPAHVNCRCHLTIKTIRTELPESVIAENCGTGAGGFQAGNTCAGEGGGASPKVQAWARKRFGDGTRAKAFAEWFGDSKVVNEDGEPLVVYHGTGQQFDVFDGKHVAGWFGGHQRAEGYASQGKNTNSQNIKPVFISLQNPLIIRSDMNDKVDTWDFLSETKLMFHYDDDIATGPQHVLHIVNSPAFVKAAKSAGYDGFVVREAGDNTIAAFHPSQIKSATGNRGTFSSKSPKITESRS